MSTRLIIFDWDGTLMDSCQRIVNCMQRAAEELALPVPSPEAAKELIGLSMQEITDRLLPDADSEASESFVRVYRDLFLYRDETDMQLYPDARETLDSFRDLGLILAVATGKARVGLAQGLQLTGLDTVIHVSRTACETAPKPDPLMLYEILEETGIGADEALMVGDTSYDLLMAQAAAVPSVAVTHGAHSEAALRACKPRHVCHSLEELLHLDSL